MKKIKNILLLSFVLQYNATYAQDYTLKSQNIYQKDNDNDDLFDQYLRKNLYFDRVVDEITKIRYKIYRYGNFFKKTKFYNNIIISMSRYYLQQLKNCSNDEEKNKIISEYQSELERIRKNRDSKNLFHIIGIKEVPIDINLTLEQINDKLRKNGFFDSTVETKTNVDGKNISIDYIVQKNNRYTIKSYNIDELSNFTNTDESFIRIGEGYKEKNFVKERKRIFELLKNSGHVFFKNRYINFFITKDSENKTLDVDLKFLTEDENSLKSFNFDTINIKLENGKNIKKAHPYKDVFYFNTGRYGKKILHRFITFRSGDPYIWQKENLFIKKILQTEVFNNAYISHNLDAQGKLLSTIHLYPEKKIKTNTDIGFSKKLNDNYELINPYISEKLLIKNFFRSLETIEFSVSLLGNLGYNNGIILAPEVQYRVSVLFPYFFPFLLLREKTSDDFFIKTGFHVKWKKIFKIADFLYYFVSKGKKDNKENISLFDFGTKCIYNVIYKNHNLDFIIAPIKLSTTRDLDKKKLYSYYLSKVKLHYIWNLDEHLDKNDFFFDDILEYGICSPRTIENVVPKDKYFKMVLTVKKTFKLPNKYKFVNRFIFGNIYFFNRSLESRHRGISPKIYFSAGGRTSIRGFDFESIGPGRSKLLSKKKKGEILLVFNNELRKKITKIIELAAFVDIGNTWRVRTKNKNEKFNSMFFKDLYIGIGSGVRLDFKFIVLSFDLGVPVRGPIKPFQAFAFYFGLNYPF